MEIRQPERGDVDALMKESNGESDAYSLDGSLTRDEAAEFFE